MTTTPPNSTRAGKREVGNREAVKRDGCDLKRSDALTRKTQEKPDKKTGMQAWWSSHAKRNNW